MNNKDVIVSIIVPCYNQAHYLDECLESVVNQSYQDWECIIVDDGSPDNTQEVALKWTKKEPRIKYLKKENGGLADARNKGIQKAKGEYILPLDADDKIAEKYIEKAVQKISEDKELGVVYCLQQKFEAENYINKTRYSSFEDLLLGNKIFCSALYRKRDWERIGGYDINMKYGLEDWEFWINLLKNTKYKVHQMEYVGFFYRIKTNGSMIKELINDNSKETLMYKYICKKHLDLYFNVFDHNINLQKKINKILANTQNIENQIRTPKLLSMLFKRIIYKMQFWK